jgi:alpha-L-fucosidase
MKKIFCIAVLFITVSSFAQTYQPTWESLDSRPVPQWFKDAKFGIFIHWGVYSVPAYCTVGNYAEWYQNGLESGDSARIKFHKEKFGNRTYYDLANDFKAELFNPDEWAKLFEASGAKYIVLTSKHHDGFCLWPSKEADRDWGFAWNAKDVGPKRDLLGDLFKAVRKTSVHAGMYYSLYEWYNPIWKVDKSKYAIEHAWPQMKDLINTYKPDVFWTDGDWDASDSVWKSKEFLAWMYNESPVKDKVVTYDRWGGDVRFHHGEVFTPEYQPNVDFEDHYWEESRGMGYSYGYNRAEDAWDYNSAQSLVLHLIDKVSRGGNFLLDIGPDSHGKIPPIMEERLLQIGEWLKINGEAIYNTVRWEVPAQWSEGKRDYHAKGGDVMLKLTVDPDPGYAVKEIFYTYNANTNSLYAIFPKYPSGGKLVIKDMTLPANTTISFLSTKENVLWKQGGENVIVELPQYDPNKIKAPYAYVLKIGNYGAFSKKPQIKVEYPNNGLQPLITLSAKANETIHYTTDGTEPTESSPAYVQPFTVEKTSLVKAKSFMVGSLPSAVAEENVKRYEWMKGAAVKGLKPGISYKYFEPDDNISLESVNANAKTSGVANSISLEKKERKDKFAFLFDGYIRIMKDGIYTFYTQSDDGSKLFIDDAEVVNNDKEHGTQEKSGRAALKKGFHTIKVVYFDSGGGNSLKALVQTEGGKKVEISPTALFH